MYGNAPLIFVPLYCKKEHRQSVEKKNLAAITGNIFFKMINLFREIVKLFIRRDSKIAFISAAILEGLYGTSNAKSL